MDWKTIYMPVNLVLSGCKFSFYNVHYVKRTTNNIGTFVVYFCLLLSTFVNKGLIVSNCRTIGFSDSCFSVILKIYLLVVHNTY